MRILSWWSDPLSLLKKVDHEREQNLAARTMPTKPLESKPKQAPRFRIAAEDRVNGIIALEKHMAEQGLDTKSPKVRIVGKTHDTVGTDNAKVSSISRYEQMYRGFCDFCFLIKDYDSAMLASREHCPKDPASVKLDTAIMYLRFHCLESGQVLTHPFTHATVFDIHGNQIVTRGDWKGTSVPGLFRSALAKLHKHYDTTDGKYIELCDDCRNLGIKAVCKGQGCSKHPSKSQYWRRGNCTTTKKFKDAVSEMEDYCENHYEARSTYAFLPGQLRDIREYLLATNNKHNMMIWTMICVGVKLFLRIDELILMTVEDFKTDYFVVTKDNVEGLCVKIQGKKETTALPFMMWDDKDCPDFSPTKAILAWIAYSGIKSGPIFPTKEQLEAGVAEPTDHYSYESFLQQMKFLCIHILKEDLESDQMKNLLIGTHMLRKSAFLMAYWGFILSGRTASENKLNAMDEANILQSARHKNISSTATYLSDSGTLKELLDRTDAKNARHKVGVWKPIHMKTLHQFAALNVKSNQFIQPLFQLSKWWIFGVLQVQNNAQLSIPNITRAAFQHTPDLSVDAKMKAAIDKVADPQMREEIKSAVQSAIAEHVKAAMNPHFLLPAADSLTPFATPIAVAGAGTDLAAADIASRKRKTPDPSNIILALSRDYQKEVNATKAKKSKIALIVGAVAEAKAKIKETNKSLGDPLKTWLYRVGKIDDCIQTCHGGSVDGFLEANGSLPFSKFKICGGGQGIEHKACFDVASL